MFDNIDGTIDYKYIRYHAAVAHLYDRDEMIPLKEEYVKFGYDAGLTPEELIACLIPNIYITIKT